ncbi:MAG: hypothetical protein WA144_13860 [Candidatus Methanoperedens sp.]
MNKNTKFLIIIFLILFSIGLAKAGEMDWHKPTPCFGCHLETIKADYGSQECGNCHDYKYNVPLLESDHNPKICTACHFGNTMVNASMKEIFHNGHNNIECTRCHTEDNFTVIKIKNNGFVCVSCHSNKVHSIHVNKIDKICKICHGSWANGKVYNTNSPSSNTSKESAQLEKFTIFYFIKSLFNTIFGVK